MTAEEVCRMLQGALEYAKFPAVQVVAGAGSSALFLVDDNNDAFYVQCKDGSKFAVIVQDISDRT